MSQPSNGQIASPSFNFQHMNDVIQTKENELKNMLYQRTIQLENYIKNREELLLETTTKYETLKEDFDYNLSLIEARDFEIQRLEKSLEDEKKRKIDTESRLRKVSQENQLLLQKEIELNHRLDQEKQSHKKILEELKAVIESVQWSAEEEYKMKNLEIEKLKNEIQMLHKQKEEALERQRLELTNSFQDILHLSEKKLIDKENDLSKQILIIDSRIDHLTNENLKLKKLLQEETISNDSLTKQFLDIKEKYSQKEYLCHELQQEILVKEKNISLLKQSFETDKKQKEDLYQNELQHKGLLLQAVQSERSILETANSELTKELQEFKKLHELSKESSSKEMQDFYQKYTSVSATNKELVQEKEILLEKLSNKLLENDSLLQQNNLLSQELSTLQTAYQVLSKENVTLQSSYQLTLAELTSIKVNEKDKVRENEKMIEIIKNEGNTLAEKEKEKIKLQYENEINEIKRNFLNEIHEYKENYEKQLDLLKNEKNSLNMELKSRDKELSENTLELKAVKHRMELYQQQLLQLQQQMKGLGGNRNPPPLNIIADPSMQPYNSVDPIPTKSTEFSLSDIDFNFPLSPLVSGDYGPPSNTQRSGLLSPQRAQLQKLAASQKQLNNNNFNNPSEYKGIAERESFPSDQLSKENQFLKQTIRELREEMENLKEVNQSHNSKNPDIAVETEVTSDEFRNLESSLEESKQEIMRLREERKQLMDMSNQYKFSLMKAQQNQLQDNEFLFEKKRKENLHQIYNWISADNPNDVMASEDFQTESEYGEEEPLPYHPESNYRNELLSPPRPPSSTKRPVTSTSSTAKPAANLMKDPSMEVIGEKIDNQDKKRFSLSASNIRRQSVTAGYQPSSSDISSTEAFPLQGNKSLKKKNSDKVTVSQMQALNKMKQQSLQRKESFTPQSQILPKKGINYNQLKETGSQ